ncbi:MAG: hypothetical protein H0X43_14080 [Nitrosospira sp.]|nr:hypothetical protein [Nitrosospira sp.]
MKSLLFAIPFIAACNTISGDNKSIDPENSQGIYSLTTLYGGSVGAREQALAWLDIDATNLCGSPYKLIEEESIPNLNRLGEVISSRLMWKIKCEGAGELPPP